MPDLPPICRPALRPWKMFVGSLAAAFAVEGAIMVALPGDLYLQLGNTGVALLDSFLLALILAPLLWWLVVRPLSELAEFRSRILQWAMNCEDRKAQQLSRELHDGVGQLAASMTLGLKSIEVDSTDPVSRQKARELRAIGHELHQSIRTLARGVRPAALDDLGLHAALENCLMDVSTSHHVAVTSRLDCLEGIRLPTPVETSLFRVLQEAVTNAVRHGRPKSVTLDGQLEPDGLRFIVRDDGKGFVPAEALQHRSNYNGPFGLLSMRERCRLLGGDLAITSTADRGTTIEVSIPLHRSQMTHEQDLDRDRGRPPVVPVGAAATDQQSAGYGGRC